MPDFWQFPTGSMGIGVINAIYQARFMRYLEHRGLMAHSDRRVWGVYGDGEMDEPELHRRADARGARKARQPDLRHQLQSSATRRAGARQRADHPGAGVAVHRRRLERDQGALGLRLGRPVRPRQAARAACAGSPRPSTANIRISARATATTTARSSSGRDPESSALVETHDRPPRSTALTPRRP